MARKNYHRLTFEDRKIAEKMYKNGASNIAVAEKIGVSRSTMNREYKRGINPLTNMYEAEYSQKMLFR